ncbi:NAD(P)/FAD-dependent oxidoreductase [Marinimicrobium locisalis]|uniref:NAD(P)/FAD-dependent oxidoreductase n=1 Tax=Marinimicrobium locisalis TaxID=546022 RepID=UPI0032214BF9
MNALDGSETKRIAVIGSGISGLTAAYVLAKRHEITLFEAGPQVGGHTATKSVEVAGSTYEVDTGFIVFNDRTYPNFIRLLSHLGVASQATDMGFSVTQPDHAHEYSGCGLSGLFAQRRNWFRPFHWKMLKDIVRFNRDCTRAYEQNRIDSNQTLGEYLAAQGYSDFFQQHYILPMVSAIWSSGLTGAAQMPLLFFIRFFHNHGLLTVTNQPQWYTVKGGSHSYLKPITREFAEQVYTDCPVTQVRRTGTGATVITERFGAQDFDEVIFACHSDQALKLLADPSGREQEVLSAMPYQDNEVVMHTDASILPKARRAWASWNYRLDPSRQSEAVLTYNMNLLQRLECPETICVSVNATDWLDERRILGRYRYSHPVFNRQSIDAQERWGDISGVNHTHYCGAYWRNGFHEDGVVSGLRVAQCVGETF